MTHFAREDRVLLKDCIVISESMSLGFADLGFATPEAAVPIRAGESFFAGDDTS